MDRVMRGKFLVYDVYVGCKVKCIVFFIVGFG